MKKIFFIVFFVSVFAGLFLLRVPIVQQLSPKVAKYYGFDISSFEISQIDAGKIVVPMLAMRHVDKSFRADIEIHNLVADIDKYKAEVIAASSSYVYVEVISTGTTTTSTSERSVREIIKLLPIFGIDIERLELKYRALNGELIHFNGELFYTQKATLKGMLNYESGLGVVLSMSINAADFSFEAVQDDIAIIAMAGNYDVQDDWLTARFAGDVSFTAINKLLLAFDIDEYIQQDATKIEAKLEMDLTRSTQNVMRTLAAEVDIDSSFNIASKQLDIKQAKIDVRSHCRIGKLDFIACSFRDPQRAVIKFEQAPDWLNQYFDDAEHEYVVEINPGNEVLAQLSFKEVFAVNVKGDAAVDVVTKTSHVKVRSLFSELNFDGIYQDWQLATGYQLKLEARNVAVPAKISRLLIEGQGDVHANNKHLTILVEDSFTANALGVNNQKYKTKKIQLESRNNAEIFYRYKDDYIGAKDIRVSLSSKRLMHANVEVDLTPIELHIRSLDYSNAEKDIDAKIHMDAFTRIERGSPLTLSQLNADVDLDGDQVFINGDMELGEQKHALNFSAIHDLGAGLGSGVVNADAIALAGNEIVANSISQSGLPLQLKGGELDVGVDAIWNIDNSVSEISIKLLAERVKGDYAQNQFSDLNVALEFVGQDGWKLTRAADIKIGHVNVGVPLKDVSMRLDRMEYQVQEQPLVGLSDIYASALDGSIYSKQIEVDLNRRENEFSIFLSSLSLDKLIALNQTEDLVASGTLDGELPMHLDDGVLLIDGGWLSANEDGGYIKYARIGEVLVGNENLQLVGELLEDFQYSEMSARVDLVSGGELTLATKLHGRSPNAALNKQVNLNFKIDFNLWKFLESARLLTHIDQDISEQVLSNQKH
ncbi:MAG: YdbH domain-containing protein [Gammaproteobacteria bacterium]